MEKIILTSILLLIMSSSSVYGASFVNSQTVEEYYHLADKLYAHGVLDLSTILQYYNARDVWKGTPTSQTANSIIIGVMNDFTDRTPTTNDQLSSEQYYLKFTKIDAAEKPYSTSPIVVAVIDDGIYVNHDDLRDNIWKNNGEIIGNDKDDDSNGYVDDIYGYDFIGMTPEMTVRGSHGTHVAGIIGAVSGNGLGIQGVVSNIKLMPLIACGDTGCSRDSIIKAIHYAVDNGAAIINLSLGSQGTTAYSTQYNDAVKYAFDRGVLIVAAAGNGDLEGGVGQDLNVIPQSPVCNDNDQNMVLGVGSATYTLYRSTWSNYGNCVDIYAPGESILSTAVPAYDNGSIYSSEDGTSFSAPIVSGIAALIKQRHSSINPREITELIKKTAWNQIVDATKALSTDYDKYPAVTPAPIQQPVTPGTIVSPLDNNSIDQTNSVFITEQISKLVSPNTALIGKLKGTILLQVQTYGAAWYLHPITLNRFYLKDGATAYEMLRAFGLGITETDYAKIAAGNLSLKSKLSGRIILRVQAHGEAYYINPKDLSVTYLKDGQAAYQAMRNLSLGITDADIAKIPIKRFVPIAK